jgi:enoyl-CoA hydratase/carnithine racemase
MDYASFATRNLQIETRDEIAIATMNRPAKRNAIDYPLHEALEEAFRVLGHDPDVSAVVLTGAGTAFCAGGDVAGFYPEGSGPLSTIRCRHLVNAIVHCEAPVIAAVNGVAAGLGATIALLCDVIFMADSARIGDTHVNMGLVAGDGGAVIWPLLIGPHRAKEFLMTGKLVAAKDAADMGLVNHVVAADRLLDEALAYARELTARPKPAVRWTKMLINQVLQQNMNLMLNLGYATEQLSSHTEDQKEAVAAFFEKRKPKFTGR